MYEIEKFKITDSLAFKNCLKVRKQVFIGEQGIASELEYDDDKVNAEYLLIRSGGKPVATCRWRITEKGIKLERFAVLKSYRRKGLGSLLVSEALKSVLHQGLKIYIHSQEGAVGFYEKNKFKITGNSFTEAGIKHYFMEYMG
jgi:predicted GNAT family N-acyltransferase